MSQTLEQQRRPGSAQLWILVALFALPAAAAWFYYLNPDLLPQGRSNNGQLIEPVQNISAMRLATFSGEDLDLGSMQPKWTLLVLGDETCAETCRERARDIRQIQKALADNGSRMERLLVLPGEGHSLGSIRALGSSFPGMHLASASGELLEILAASQAGGGAGVENNVFIVDPQSNLMMRYQPDATAKEILKDMEKLMKASKNWVKGAQYGHR